jgi:hypothetical protein
VLAMVASLRATRRGLLVLLLVALAELQAAPLAVAVPKPDPSPAPRPSAEAPAPDPFPGTQDSQPSPTSSSAGSRASPDPSPTPSTTSTGSAPAPDTASTTPTWSPSDGVDSTPTPVSTSGRTDGRRTSASSDRVAPSNGTTTRRRVRPARTAESAAAAPRRTPRLRNPGPSGRPALSAVTASGDERGLVLGGLALLTLALASTSLLFFVTRAGVQEARP